MLSADALGVPPEGVKLACGSVLADTKAVIKPSAGCIDRGRFRKQEKTLRWVQM
jgi:hypothetical protein